MIHISNNKGTKNRCAEKLSMPVNGIESLMEVFSIVPGSAASKVASYKLGIPSGKIRQPPVVNLGGQRATPAFEPRQSKIYSTFFPALGPGVVR